MRLFEGKVQEIKGVMERKVMGGIVEMKGIKVSVGLRKRNLDVSGVEELVRMIRREGESERWV